MGGLGAALGAGAAISDKRDVALVVPGEVRARDGPEVSRNAVQQ